MDRPVGPIIIHVLRTEDMGPSGRK